jgi:hypothetical protein
MRVRWIGLVLALLLLGAGVGYGVGALAGHDPTTLAAAHPVPAESPSIPVLPTPSYAPDISYPPLRPGLEYKPHVIGGPGYEWSYDVPRGWTIEPVAFAEVRWRPADEPLVGGYSLRVKILNQHSTPAEMVAAKKAAVESIYDDVEVTDESDDVLSFRYREPDTNRLRFNTFQWFTPPESATADFEMSVVGREPDVDGLEALLDHVAASVRQVG